MRKILLFVLILSFTAAGMIGCGDSSKKIIPQPAAFTSNFAFIQSLMSSNASAAVRTHFDVRGQRATQLFRHKPALRQGLKPMFENEPGSDSIVMMKNDGTNKLVLADQLGWFYAVQLSLDGKMAVGTADDLNGYEQVYVVDLSNLSNVNNLNPVQLTSDAEDHYVPQLSPDNKTVIFVKDIEIGIQAFTIPVAGGTETMIHVPDGVYVNYPSYTPDGKKIVFEEEENDTIDIMNADGTGVTTLTNQDFAFYDEFPSVSPDGKTIAFSRYGYNESGGENIFTVSISGGSVQQLTTDGESWDPLFVNNKIVFVSYRDAAGGGRIYAMMPDGSSQTNLTSTDTTDDYFIW